MKLVAGMSAPDFDLKDADGRSWSLTELRGKKVVLYFYPADDTPGCTAEACDFRDANGEFQAAGYQVLGVSPQDAESHSDFAAKYGLNFPLLVDSDMKVAEAYGAVRDAPGDYKGIPLHILRSTFIIDENGKITEALYGVNGRGHVADIRDILVLSAE